MGATNGFCSISRRHLLQGSAALTLGTAFGARSAFAADTTIGFIYVGSRDDYGYNQAHAQAPRRSRRCLASGHRGRKGSGNRRRRKTMESMINLDGATLLFPTSFGYYNPHMIKMANKFQSFASNIAAACGPTGPKNAGSYFGYIDEAQYISGIVAGYTARPASSASSPPNRFRRYCETSMPLRSRQTRQSESHHAGDLHR